MKEKIKVFIGAVILTIAFCLLVVYPHFKIKDQKRVNVPVSVDMSAEKKQWMADCNQMRQRFEQIKSYNVARCLISCDRVSNAHIKDDKKMKDLNTQSCQKECDKGKIDIFEDVFFLERKVDEKYHCHYKY
jgi:hypothetical protein